MSDIMDILEHWADTGLVEMKFSQATGDRCWWAAEVVQSDRAPGGRRYTWEGGGVTLLAAMHQTALELDSLQTRGFFGLDVDSLSVTSHR